ncbi:hypothetical protein DFH11DRAFT_1206023 [Phellopilus nigrolimitatus]|nr:hypothetical protein DFH11DRAFT_1206023 [Phellopilus nigrolimitatus]
MLNSEVHFAFMRMVSSLLVLRLLYSLLCEGTTGISARSCMLLLQSSPALEHFSGLITEDGFLPGNHHLSNVYTYILRSLELHYRPNVPVSVL